MLRIFQRGWSCLAVGLVAATMAATVGQPAVAAEPDGQTVVISGRVLDGSAHGWPIFAELYSGTGGNRFHNDPVTGRYEITVPVNTTEYIAVTTSYPGYVSNPTLETWIYVGTTDITHDFVASIDPEECSAPGYAENVRGLGERFSEQQTPPGWQNIPSSTGSPWAFVTTTGGGYENLTGGDDGFAVAHDFRDRGPQPSELRTPMVDLTGVATPVLRFKTAYSVLDDRALEADVSVDGGASWQTVFSVNSGRSFELVQIDLPQAAGQTAVQARFRYIGSVGAYWQVDDFILGQRSCEAADGGLIVGHVRDANTGLGLNNSTVASAEQPADHAITYEVWYGPCRCLGFYWLFSTLTGIHEFTASHSGYVTARRTVDVATRQVSRADFVLGAGHITVTPDPVAATVLLGEQTRTTVTVTNTGSVPVNVTLGERLDQRPAAEPAWQPIADPPTPLDDGAATAGDNKVYVIGGSGTARADVYDPWTDTWSRIADPRESRSGPGAAFVAGKLYVLGGQAGPTGFLEVYDPAANTWTYAAQPPVGYSYSGLAVLNGRIYLVGGCGAGSCWHNDVLSYDPATDNWSRAADYPVATFGLACGGVLGRIYCAGGAKGAPDGGTSGTVATYAYDPGTNVWSRMADLPSDLYLSAYAATSGHLVLVGGAGSGGHLPTDVGYAYRPGTNSWTELPAAAASFAGGAGACGFYRIGGQNRHGYVLSAQMLKDFNQCGQNVVPWLMSATSSLVLAPGGSAEVELTMDASRVSQPGAHTAFLTVDTDTPYDSRLIPVTMTVTPPANWGSVSGTVTGAACAGDQPVAGAIVQVTSPAGTGFVQTSADGRYVYWLLAGSVAATAIVAKDGWQPQQGQAVINAGQSTVLDWRLQPTRPCQPPGTTGQDAV